MSVDVDVMAVETLKVVAEPLRWRILHLLAGEELCVCHLVDALGVNQPLVSHHLRVLRDAGLVECSRYRYWTYYRLRTGVLTPLVDAFQDLVAGSAEGERRRPCC